MSFWNHVMLAAIHGKLGRLDDARPHIRRVSESKPDFAGAARELIRRSLKIDPLIADLIDGLRRAGMAIGS
jgi:hypothetical protein